MLLYTRYFIKNIAHSFFIISLIIIGTMLLIQGMKIIYLIDRGILLHQYLYLLILTLPSLLFTLLPFVTSIAIIYTYFKLIQERQILILQNIGLNNIKIAKPAFIIMIFITIIDLFISSHLMPFIQCKLKYNLAHLRDNFLFSTIHEKTFNKVSESIIIYINQKTKYNTFNNIIIFDYTNKKYDNPIITVADYGYLKIINHNIIFKLQDGTRYSYDNHNNTTKLNFEFLNIELKNSHNNNDIVIHKDVNEMYFYELYFPDKNFSVSKQKRLKVELHQRILWVAYNFIFGFSALGMLLYFPYTKKPQHKHLFFTSLLILYMCFVHFSLYNLAVKNLNFIYLMYIHCIINMLIGYYLYYKNSYFINKKIIST